MTDLDAERACHCSGAHISSPSFTFYNIVSRRLNHKTDVALSPLCHMMAVLLALWAVRGSSLRA
jgi:hypothetical protein